MTAQPWVTDPSNLLPGRHHWDRRVVFKPDPFPVPVLDVYTSSSFSHLHEWASMVVLSLLLKPCLSRIVQLAASLIYALTISAAALGETWAHNVVARVAELVLHAVIARTA